VAIAWPLWLIGICPIGLWPTGIDIAPLSAGCAGIGIGIAPEGLDAGGERTGAGPGIAMPCPVGIGIAGIACVFFFGTVGLMGRGDFAVSRFFALDFDIGFLAGVFLAAVGMCMPGMFICAAAGAPTTTTAAATMLAIS
jgi:hypothetical protein